MRGSNLKLLPDPTDCAELHEVNLKPKHIEHRIVIWWLWLDWELVGLAGLAGLAFPESRWGMGRSSPAGAWLD